MLPSSMSLLALLAHLWLALVNCSTLELVIDVNNHGVDSTLCLKGNETCKSLHFVLRSLAGGRLSNVDTILVNISSNQTILGQWQYNLTLPVNVTVSGINRPYILCKQNSSLSITADKPTQTVWIWKGLVFYGCGYLTPDDSAEPGLYHANFNSVTIIDCLLKMLTQIQLCSIQHVVISNNDFTQNMAGHGNRCSPIINCNGSSFIFSGNTIMNYLCNEVTISHNGFFYVSNFVNVIIADNTISNIAIHGWTDGADLISIEQFIINERLKQIIFRNNSFTNILTSGDIVQSESLETHTLQCIIETNTFSMISRINEHLDMPTCMDLLACNHANFLNNRFFNNSDFILIDFSSTLLVINELILVNNTISHASPAILVFIESDSFAMSDVSAKQNYIYSHQADALFILVGRVLTMKNMTFIKNSVALSTHSALFLVSGCNMSITNAVFTDNFGTPLNINKNDNCPDNSSLNVLGTHLFSSNTGIRGGAISIYLIPVNFISLNLILEGNSAVYGGGLYFSSVLSIYCKKVFIQSQNNTAMTAGNFIYFASIPDDSGSWSCGVFQNYSGVNSVPKTISFLFGDNVNGHLSIFPGQEIVANVSVIDYFDQPSSCDTEVYLMCNGGSVNCANQNIMLEGPATVILSQPAFTNMTTVYTNLILSSPLSTSVNVSVTFSCKVLDNPVSVDYHIAYSELPLNITTCPVGFTYNKSARVCECVEVVDIQNFRCSAKFGAACVSYGYWYGAINTSDTTEDYVVASCSFPDCKYTYKSCPNQLQPTGSNSKFVLLEFDIDDQCYSGRGGVLCRNCRPGFEFTFTAVNCISNTTCNQWQPYLVIPISLVFQILFALFLILVVRFKTTLGSGFLYGPMLFLSVISNLSLAYYPQYSFLSTFISVLSSIPLLNLEVIGFIPWCFFQRLDKVYNYSLRYLGPLTVLVVIIFVTFIARRCPNALQLLQNSPLRALCILMILSFWSLANTSVKILTPTVISESLTSSSYVVSLQPEMRYFSWWHLPVAIPALLVLVLLISPLLTLLLFFPLLSKVINLHRIKPFIDEFHACYCDSFRWYSAVYFIVWMVAIIISGFSVNLVITQALFVLLLTSHILIQPYCSKLLNITDSLLLVNINFLLALFHSDSVTTPVAVVLVHVLTIGPLLCISGWFIGFALYKCFCTICTRIKRLGTVNGNIQAQNVSSPQRVRIFEDSEREPLITIMDYQ